MSVTWEWQRFLKVLLLRSTASLAGSLWQAAENQDPSQSLPGALCEQGRGTVERWISFWNLTAFFLRILLYPDPALLLQANCSSRADVDPAAFSSPGRSSGFQTILFTRQTLEPFLQETYFTHRYAQCNTQKGRTQWWTCDRCGILQGKCSASKHKHSPWWKNRRHARDLPWFGLPFLPD